MPGVREFVERVERKVGIRRSRTRKSVSRLLEYGYNIYWVSDSGREYGFKCSRS
jgi:hypothetical protein